ncbi:unnamed protein product [Candida verbasci]|uniref:Uncharacterized protein n=1 Tax=Candida verbasci TaxID=1227364 RepID=A0A9W4TY11_9ASCO|nr:unnamed protein product [Candida verbasci]
MNLDDELRVKKRWKSINDERVFLSNINDSLLPPVLKNFQDQEDYSNVMIGLEDIPKNDTISKKSQSYINLNNVKDYEKIRNISGYSLTPGTNYIEKRPVSQRSLSAPSITLAPISSKHSPPKKLSPKKIFKSNSLHKHSNSVTTQISNFSSRSNSPKKLKSFLKLHKHSVSVPNFQTTTNSKFNQLSPKNIEPIDLWDIQTTTNFSIDDQPPHTGENSRISSLPSQVIGEYDKEKWRTLKVLNKNENI